MKTVIVILCMVLGSWAAYYVVPVKHQSKPFKYAGYETSDTNYVNGQILYPDYVHNDTLIVVNSDSLNWCMKNYDIASDGDIQDVLNAYCKPYRAMLKDNE